MTSLDERPVTSTARLLAGIGNDTLSLARHHDVHGRLPVGLDPALLRQEISRSGLLGRGGAGFPVGRKLEAVAGNRGPRVVVANGAESEPSSRKDAVLLTRNPHLVLDGLEVAARAVKAKEAHLVVERGSSTLRAIHTALAQRDGRGDHGSPQIQVHELPRRYVASEASALVRWLSGGEAKPTFGIRAADRGVNGRPTYVGNVETLAAAALIARHGARWWRSSGDPHEPGTQLVTVTTPGHSPRVLEIPTGMTVGSVLDLAGTDIKELAGVVIGGWGGSWLTPDEAVTAELSHRGMNAIGADFGCASIVALGTDTCPVVEVAAVAGWLAGQAASQCGPCVHGLPAIADALRRLAAGRPAATDEAALARWTAVIPRRGACAHPDGAVSFVASALRVFGRHVAAHRTRGACPVAHFPATLAIPTMDGGWR